MRIFVAAVAMALLTAPAYSQSSPFGSGSKKPHTPPEEKSESRKLVDDKAYKAALDRIQTDKKYDPWRNAR